MSLNVRTTPEDDHHVRAIDEWWRQQRTAAPNLFLEELEAVFALIADDQAAADQTVDISCTGLADDTAFQSPVISAARVTALVSLTRPP